MQAEITRMTPNGPTKLSTHVLDLVSGLPAPGLAVKLYDPEDALISSAITNEDGRIEAWDGAVDLGSGTYRLYSISLVTDKRMEPVNMICFSRG